MRNRRKATSAQLRKYYIAIAALSCILAALILVAVNLDKPDVPPASTTAADKTTAGKCDEKPKPTEPDDEPKDDAPLYSREFLESLSKEADTYWFGDTKDGIRPAHPVELQEKYKKYDTNFIAPDENKAYLTFDCGYEYIHTKEDGTKVRVTEWILDVLKEKKVKAVFFVTMSYCKSQPELVQRMISEGHAVGNHTTTHPKMPSLSIDKMEEEVMTLHNYVKEQFGYEMHLFRPPEGAYSEQSLAVVQNLGYKTVHWSVAHSDWDPENQPTVEDGYHIVTKRHHPGAIYLLHAESVTNATMLGDVIEFLQGKEYALSLLQ